MIIVAAIIMDLFDSRGDIFRRGCCTGKARSGRSNQNDSTCILMVFDQVFLKPTRRLI
jgi:hypothetical protein